MDIIYKDEKGILSLNEDGILLEPESNQAGEIEILPEDVDLIFPGTEMLAVKKITFRFRPERKASMKKIALSFRFLPDREELWEKAREAFHWIPNICHEKGDVASDHVFRSPACMATVDGFCGALVPDLDDIRDRRITPRYLSMDYSGPPRLEYGIMPTRPSGHVYYAPTGEEFTATGQGKGFSLYVITCSDMDGKGFLKTVSRFIWHQNAGEYLRDVTPQTVPFSKYAFYGNAMALRYLWQQGPRKDSGGIMLTTFRDEDGVIGGREYKNDLWFHAWFNNMRTALELYEFGTLLDREEWRRKAMSIASLIVNAPRRKGIFPTIYAPRDGGWVLSSREHGGGENLYSLVDCAWTCLWLRKFIAGGRFVRGAEKMLAGFRGFLLDHQNPTGGFPCWVHRETFLPDPRLNDKACGAMPLWFLAEEAASGNLAPVERKQVMSALEKGAAHLMGTLIPAQLFQDFELYYSCSKKPLDFYDGQTCLYPQNTLAMQWCAGFLRTLHVLTGKAATLENAMFCMDLLCMYQQVWNPPYLSHHAFGGFGVMNTDGEWNDARQAQFAVTLADFYEATGDFTYLERAVAATRASFALMAIRENKEVCPMNHMGTGMYFEVHGGSAENHGHGGQDSRNYQSGFHWGTGSALVTAWEMKKRYKDLFIDLQNKKAVGIDGMAVRELAFEGDTAILSVITLEGITSFDVLVRGGGLDRALPVIEGHIIQKTKTPGLYRAEKK
ncbi:MAG: hypothetical protein R6W96_04335 [Clostridia bacterium]